MECGAKAEPGRICKVARSADFRVPAIGHSLAVHAFRLAFSCGANTGILAPHTRSNQRKGIAHNERIVGQGCGFPVIRLANPHEVLVSEGRARRRYPEALIPSLNTCVGRSVFCFKGGEDATFTLVEGCVSRRRTRSGGQKRFYKDSPIENIHLAGTTV